MESNWTIDLLVGDGDVTFHNKFPLVYVASTQERYQLNQNDGGIEGQEPNILWHASDNASPIPARITEANKTGRWVLSIFDDENDTPEWDTILNNVHAINRHMSGATSTASRHAIDGTAQKVRIAITPQGATNTTYYDVQSGYADVSKSYYTAESQQTTTLPAQRGAWFIPINFVFTEAGYGDSFTLRNDLPSSPHFIEDSNSDGLADGWTATSISGNTINTDIYLIGGASQELLMFSAAVARYIVSDLATVPIGTSIAACLWIRGKTSSNHDVITVRLQDGGGNVVIEKRFEKDDAGGVSDKQVMENDGRLWYRVPLIGVNSSAANARLVIIRSVADALVGANILLDGAYIQGGATELFNGYCSSSSLKNRYDPTSTSAATRQRINYLDVWGIPGDLPAYARHNVTLNYTTVIDQNLTVGKHLADSKLFNNMIVLECEDFSGGSTITDSTRSGGEYWRATGTSAQGVFVNTASSGEWLIGRDWRVFAVAKTNNTAATINLNYLIYTSLVETEQKSFTGTGWETIDMGLLPLRGLCEPENIANITENIAFNMTSASSATVELDFLLFMPVDEFIISTGHDGGTDVVVTIAGDKQRVWNDTYYENMPPLGELWNAGTNGVTRYIYLATTADKEQTLDHEFTISLEIAPRTSHLLGTV